MPPRRQPPLFQPPLFAIDIDDIDAITINSFTLPPFIEAFIAIYLFSDCRRLIRHISRCHDFQPATAAAADAADTPPRLLRQPPLKLQLQIDYASFAIEAIAGFIAALFTPCRISH